MPGRHPPATLRLEPHTIPAVRMAFEDALAELTPQLLRLRRDGIIPAPWLGDPVSATVVNHYQAHVMDAPDGPLAAMRAYEIELMKIRDNLMLMEEHYRRTEGENAAVWGRA
jgi:hypothetical protein